MRDIAILGLVGAGTLGMRSVFVVGSIALPPRVERVLRHARPAILAALVGSFLAAGGSGVAVDALVALAVAWFAALRGAGMTTVLALALTVSAAMRAAGLG